MGKTYLIKEFGQNEFSNSHYFNFESDKNLNLIFEKNLNPSQIIHDLELIIEKKITETDLIIFDEIQVCPHALTSLKYFCEEKKYKIIAAGSLLGLMFNQESFPVGKVEFEELGPMTFEEFVKAKSEFIYNEYIKLPLDSMSDIMHEKLTKIYLEYLFVGGMPEVVSYFTSEKEISISIHKEVRRLQKNLQMRYLADFAKHCGKINSMHLEKVWSEVSRQIGQSLDGSIKRFKFKDVLPQKKQYSQFENIFNWLEKANLVNRTYIIDIPQVPLSTHISEAMFKAYLFDVGILNCHLDISYQEILNQEVKTFKGFIAENFVSIHLRQLGIISSFCWQKNESEIEFLINLRGEIYPLEIKSGKRTRCKSLVVYKGKYLPQKMFILSLAKFEIKNELIKVPLYGIEKYFRDLCE